MDERGKPKDEVDARARIGTLYQRLGIAETTPAVDIRATLTPDAIGNVLRPTRVEGPKGRVARARADEATGPLPRIDLAEGDPPEPADTDFVVKGLLGEGGMGRVVAARQRSLGREVAIKVLRDGVSDDARASEMLLAEALVTGTLEHPNIVPIHALGADVKGRPVLVMKRIEGVPWGALLKDPHHAAWARVEPDPNERLVANLEILMRTCDALHYAHSRGIIHRDVKPSNVMVGSFGEVYLVDWGVALRASTRRDDDLELAGTLGFLSPEMASGRIAEIDARSDVYLAGATLHMVLAGKTRHSGDSLTEVLLAAFASEPATYGEDVPAELAAICNRACAAEPSDRFEDALALRRALADFLKHRASIALCRRLAPRLDELTRLVDQRAATADGEGVDATIDQLVSECRFGYEQALREWPGNAEGKLGLRRVLAAIVRVEVLQGDAVGARAALGALTALGHPPGDLERLVAEAETRARSRDAKLERLERDHDVRVGSRQRALIVLLIVPLTLGMVTFVIRSGTAAITHERLFGFAVLVNLAIWAAIARGKRRLLETVVNRRLVLGAAVVVAVWLVNRAVGWFMRTPVNQIAATDLFVLAAVAGGVWTPYLRRFALVALVAGVGGVGATLLPPWWPAFFGSSGILVLTSFASLVWWPPPASRQ